MPQSSPAGPLPPGFRPGDIVCYSVCETLRRPEGGHIGVKTRLLAMPAGSLWRAAGSLAPALAEALGAQAFAEAPAHACIASIRTAASGAGLSQSKLFDGGLHVYLTLGPTPPDKEPGQALEEICLILSQSAEKVLGARPLWLDPILQPSKDSSIFAAEEFSAAQAACEKEALAQCSRKRKTGRRGPQGL